MASLLSERPAERADASPLVGARYRLLEEIGRGAMGVVHRASDRLGGDVVTVKLTHAAGGGAAASSLPDDVLTSLAHEFAVLASLRHPNVIRVFDYGFDPGRGPYLVMEHTVGAGTLLLKMGGARRERQIAILIDVLRALAYLHRRGIVHRDIKPENVLVDGDRAKIVDFGLSVPVDGETSDLSGTGPYLAPELLLGGAPSVKSDLWAVGIIAAELLAGRHPFEGKGLLQNVLHRAPRLEGLEGGAAKVLLRLLAKDPQGRFGSANEAAEALAATLPDHAPFETSETRESFLQASRFVGRKQELDLLSEALTPLREGVGSLWLLGGESGVGKSRLADEVAIRALVGGVRVLRGHTNADAPSPYDVWRPALRGMALTAAPTDGEAAVLRAVIPDIDALVGRAVGPAPDAEDAAAQARLLATVERLVARERTPTLVILEDLQWAGSESLRLLTWLGRVVERAPVVIVATYRDDEAPQLPSMLEGARVVKLSRLAREAVGELALAIVGRSADDRLVDGLVVETEGNPFFLVETLRAIANEAGRLEALGADHLRLSVPPEGLRRVLERRLSRPAPATRELLRLAAVAGRRLDLAALGHAWGAGDLDAHLRAAAEFAIVEAKGDSWEFSHDKLREALQRDLDADRRAEYHRRVAGGIERAHGERPDQLAALAHHWELAADEGKSMRYAELAGAHALEAGAFREAVTLVGRARAYADRRAGRARHEALFRLDATLMLAHYQLGELESARRFGELALGHVGDPIPAGALGKAVVTAREIVTRVGQSLRPGAVPRLPAAELARYARVLIVLSECFVFEMEAQSFTIAALRLTNRTAPAGPSAPLARGLLDLGMLAMITPFKGTARRWVGRAIAMAREHGAGNDHAFVSSRAGVLAITTARWGEAEGFIRNAVETATNHGDRRLLDECAVLLAAIAFFRGRHVEAGALYAAALEAARRSGTHQVARWSALGSADVALRRGRYAEAIAAYDRELASPGLVATERVWAHGMRALARLRSGDRERAGEDALVALALLDRSPPVAYWIQHGVHATSRVLLELSPPGRPSAAARRGVLHATILAGVAGLARPAAALVQGELLGRLGRPDAARWLLERGRRLGDELGMPYEAAMGDLSIARGAGGERGARLLARARDRLLAIDADGDADEARRALSGQPVGFDSARW